MAKTQLEWPLSVPRSAPVAESQSPTVLLSDVDAISLLSGEKVTEKPLSVVYSTPVAESQSLIVLLLDIDATSLPSGKKVIDLIQLE